MVKSIRVKLCLELYLLSKKMIKIFNNIPTTKPTPMPEDFRKTHNIILTGIGR